MARELLLGPIKGSTTENGKKENNMVKEFLSNPMVSLEKENGQMEGE